MHKTIYLPFFVCVYALIGCQPSPPGDEVLTGAAKLASSNFDMLKGKNVGLVTNHSAVVGDSLLIDLFHHTKEVNLVALFSPEHGIRGNADAGAHIDNSTDEKTGVPIYSLYGKTQKPTPEMLEGIDVLVFDMQDVGARFYTYIATMGRTMQAAAENDISYVVLDRPNPLGGEVTEGFIPTKEYERFNGVYPIPVTHGMTVGELAKMIKGEALLQGLDNLELNILKVQGWNRDMLWSDMNLAWTPPSPNIPNFETALIYPGACLFEATHISEGRGTQKPFIQLGAPWANGEALAEKLNNEQLPGLSFEPAMFTPKSIKGMSTNPKLEGERLEGIRYHIADYHTVRPVAAGIHVLLAFYNSAPDSVKKNYFRVSRLNTLAGSQQFHDMIQQGLPAEKIIEKWKVQTNSFRQERKKYLLY